MDKTIDALRRIRKEKGLTLKEVTELTGMSAGTVNKIFSGGIKSIKTKTAETLANALGVSLAELDVQPQAPATHESKKRCYGYAKCAALTNEVSVGDVDFNVKTTIALIEKAYKKGVTLAVFPELSLTGYTVGDLIYQDVLLRAAENGLKSVVSATANKNLLVFVGLPVKVDGRIYNCAAAAANGKLLAIYAKRNLPNYNEFYEKRYFSPAPDVTKNIDFCGFNVPFGYKIILKNTLMPEMKVSCEICEDIWVPDSPSVSHALAGSTVIVNLSASNESAGKENYRRQMVSMQSSKCLCAYIYCSSGFGESTTDVVFGGHDIIYEAGRLLGESIPFAGGEAYGDVDCAFLEYERSKKFTKPFDDAGYTYVDYACSPDAFKLERKYTRTPFVPEERARLIERCEDVMNIQSYGLLKRIKTVNPKKLVLGLSGGLDSTLAMLVCVNALKLANRPTSDLVCITMPCFGTSERTHNNAIALTKAFGTELIEVNIAKSVVSHFEDIGHDGKTVDLTYENAQARERTQVLMDYACKVGGFVVGTGDMSEAALGWSTYNGDHMSMYNVNCGVPKTLVKAMVSYFAAKIGGEVAGVLKDIVATPVSPELKPAEGGAVQSTEASVGPYVLNDFFLYHMIKHGIMPSKAYYIAKHVFAKEYSEKVIAQTLEGFIKRFFASQYKRSCVPDGVKTGSLCLSPRGDWRMPSDASRNIWLADLYSVLSEK